MPRMVSKSAANRLGSRLRKSTVINAEDLEELERVRADYADSLNEVSRILQWEFGLQPTERLKTTQSIVEKLQRSSTGTSAMALSTMQDIAGVRVVLDGSRHEQDLLVHQLVGRFADARVYDRRAVPSYGYRAVHVVVEQNDCLVEIQVRTRRQDDWAQLFERLADIWGRQIRYGEPPDRPGQAVASGVSTDRLGMVELFQKHADLIATLEEMELNVIRSGRSPSASVPTRDDRERLSFLKEQADALQKALSLLIHGMKDRA